MTLTAVEQRLVHANVEFKRFRIPLPHVTEIQSHLRVERATGLGSRGQEQSITAITGPSHAGKSTMIRDWVEGISQEEPARPGRHPVVYVSLRSSATVKSMGEDILRTLKDDQPPPDVVREEGMRHGRRPLRERDRVRGEHHQLMHMAATALENAGTEILIIDELQHLVSSDNAKVTKYSITDALKVLAIRGVCPIVCVGIRRVEGILNAKNNPQVAGRQTMPITIDPLDIGDPAQRRLFGGYVSALDLLLVESGIMSAKSGLAKADPLACLYDVSLGILGRVSRVVENAARLAIRREQDVITSQDLSDATDRWAVKQKFTDSNPWKEGCRDLRLTRQLAEKAE